VSTASYRIDFAWACSSRISSSQACARGAADVEFVDRKRPSGADARTHVQGVHHGSAPAPLEAWRRRSSPPNGSYSWLAEYNWGPQPGLKNLTDHFLEEKLVWRLQQSRELLADRFSGSACGHDMHGIRSEMDRLFISSTLAIGPISQTLEEMQSRRAHRRGIAKGPFHVFADRLAWWE